MTLSQWLWLATAAYGVHALEEFVLDWRDWARDIIRLPVDWDSFYVTNALVIVLGVTAANLADGLPGIALSFPALMLINAVFFHIVPTVATRGRFSPGLFTAVALFLPIGIACFRAAHAAGQLNTGAIATAFTIGAALMAAPIVLLKVKDRPYFRQA